ncbi:hypothetical protein D3C75_1119950 [compost metagenome]
MENHLNVVIIHIEKPMGLNNLQPFVDHGGGIDGNLGAHGPIGMAQSLLHRNTNQLGAGTVPEGAAGCGDNQLMYILGGFSV